MTESGIWAFVPIKEMSGAKQRLAGVLAPHQRRALVVAMAEDVLAMLVRVRRLAGIVVGTVDPVAIGLAKRFGARVLAEGARDGHTGAVAAAARILGREGRSGMLTLPADIPGAIAAEVEAVLAAHRPAPSFTIVPAHDGRGSNAVLVSPPDAVPLRFGDDSFQPHLGSARRLGIEPTVVRLPGIGLDIDNPTDLAAILDRLPASAIRTHAVLPALGMATEEAGAG